MRVRRGPFGSVILAVSDGHGGPHSFRSDRGAALAVTGAVELLRRLLLRLGPDAPLSVVRRQMASYWRHRVVADWRQAVRADVRAHPFSPLDFAAFPGPIPATPPEGEWPFNAYLAYGATLLTVALTRRYLICAQLGDGDILTVRSDGLVTRPLVRQHDFYDEESASLCTHGAPHEIQTAVLPARVHPPALVMLSSDGYANCFGNDEGFFKVGSDLLDYARDRGTGFLAEHLGAWLHNSSRDGSGDDITVALALRRGATHPARQAAAKATLHPPRS